MRTPHRMMNVLLGLTLTVACTGKPGRGTQPEVERAARAERPPAAVAAALAAWEPVDKGFTGCAGG